MAFKPVSNTNYTLDLIAGDTEYIRLNIKDENGEVLDVSSDYICTLGIKRKELDSEFIIPEITSTMYEYDVYEQPYSVEFKLESDDTIDLLNYNGKERKSLKCYYDIELYNTFLGVNERTTLVSGPLNIARSISGRVV